MVTVNYKVFKENYTKKLNNFISKNVFFAFSEQQYADGLAKFNVKPEQAKEKFHRFYGGGFILIESEQQYNKITKGMHKARRKYLKNFKNLVSALEYEMHNHECGYTGRYMDGLESLGYSKQDLRKNKKLLKAYFIAKKKVYNWFIENN